MQRDGDQHHPVLSGIMFEFRLSRGGRGHLPPRWGLLSSSAARGLVQYALLRYQADCDGEWGELFFNCETGEAENLSLAEWDTTKTHRFANRAIRFLRDPEKPNLPKTAMVAFEK